jgi:hypothetical protein
VGRPALLRVSRQVSFCFGFINKCLQSPEQCDLLRAQCRNLQGPLRYITLFAVITVWGNLPSFEPVNELQACIGNAGVQYDGLISTRGNQKVFTGPRKEYLACHCAEHFCH